MSAAKAANSFPRLAAGPVTQPRGGAELAIFMSI